MSNDYHKKLIFLFIYLLGKILVVNDFGQFFCCGSSRWVETHNEVSFLSGNTATGNYFNLYLIKEDCNHNDPQIYFQECF